MSEGQIEVPVFQEVINLENRNVEKSYTHNPIEKEEIYGWVRQIRDPEHPTMTLQDLKVVNMDDLYISDQQNYCRVIFTPTTPQCTMGAILGLSIKIVLMQILPLRFTIEVICKENTHDTWSQLNKQLNDKERVLASLQNQNIMQVVYASIKPK